MNWVQVNNFSYGSTCLGVKLFKIFIKNKKIIIYEIKRLLGNKIIFPFLKQ